MQLAGVIAAAVPLAWLLPNHYAPWPSAWSDALAIAVLAVAAMLCRQRGALPVSWRAVLGLALLSVLGQWLTGRNAYFGDVVMVTLYFFAFALAFVLGSALAGQQPEGSSAHFLTVAHGGLVVAALASTAIAYVQWTGAVSLGIYGADLPPGGRPFANVAQPNHFCTIAFLGLCSVAVLRESGRIGWSNFAATSTLLLSGMVLSGSRTGWVQIALALAMAVTLAARAHLRVGPRQVLALAAIFIGLNVALPMVAKIHERGVPREAAAQLEAGTRLAHWRALADAVGRAPVRGYGWLQVATAQQAVAADHPAVGEHIEHSHNIMLDLFVWAGLPVGGLILVLACWALFGQLASARDPRAAWILIGVAGLLAHANVEFPLEYAYFLIPMGLALGTVYALRTPAPAAGIAPWAIQGCGLLLGAALLAVAADYIKAEENFRMLRLETARIGVTKLETPAPDLRLLDQLQSFLEFTRAEARPGMSPEQLDDMRRVAERFGYAPALFRYALAAGLNGRADIATQMLVRLCHIHPAPRCDEARQIWPQLQNRYPELGRVPAP